MSINIELNGQSTTLPANTTLDKAIILWELVPNTFAVAINGRFIPKAAYASTELLENNRIEIVTAMQGG